MALLETDSTNCFNVMRLLIELSLLFQYIGNLHLWSLETPQVEEFHSKSAKIRETASVVYEKFKVSHLTKADLCLLIMQSSSLNITNLSCATDDKTKIFIWSFQELFTFPDESSFWSKFADKQKSFQGKYNILSQSDLFEGLTIEGKLTS